jgi:hypothetical protein
LVIPLLKAVYTGEEFFWLQYPIWRIFIILVYFIATLISALISFELQKKY